MKRLIKRITPTRTQFKAELPGVDFSLIKPTNVLKEVRSGRQPVKVFIRFTWKF